MCLTTFYMASLYNEAMSLLSLHVSSKRDHICGPSSLLLPVPESTQQKVSGQKTHCVTAGWVQHRSWSVKQAEELRAAPLLYWQVPAWVDHVQRQQRHGHGLRGRERGGEGGARTFCTKHRTLSMSYPCVRAKFLSELPPRMLVLYEHLAEPWVRGVAAGFMTTDKS